MSRRDAYLWLQQVTGMTAHDCHFRYFDIGMCEAIEIESRRKLKSMQQKRRRRAKRRFDLSFGGVRKV